MIFLIFLLRLASASITCTTSQLNNLIPGTNVTLSCFTTSFNGLAVSGPVEIIIKNRSTAIVNYRVSNNSMEQIACSDEDDACFFYFEASPKIVQNSKTFKTAEQDSYIISSSTFIKEKAFLDFSEIIQIIIICFIYVVSFLVSELFRTQ